MLVNKFDLLDALIFSNSTNNCQMFLKLESIYINISNEEEFVFIEDEDLLDYINIVNVMRYQDNRKKTNFRIKKKLETDRDS